MTYVEFEGSLNIHLLEAEVSSEYADNLILNRQFLTSVMWKRAASNLLNFLLKEGTSRSYTYLRNAGFIIEGISE